MVIHGVPVVIEQEDLSFDDGIRVLTAVPLIVINANEESIGTLTDNLIAPGTRGLLFSSRLRQVLMGEGVDNIDYYPTKIIGLGSGISNEDYQLANIVGRIRCVDFAASDIDMHPDFPDTIEFINALALDENRIEESLMFRLAEHCQVIVVHERVKAACERAGITGIQFFQPSDFSF